MILCAPSRPLLFSPRRRFAARASAMPVVYSRERQHPRHVWRRYAICLQHVQHRLLPVMALFYGVTPLLLQRYKRAPIFALCSSAAAREQAVDRRFATLSFGVCRLESVDSVTIQMAALRAQYAFLQVCAQSPRQMAS